MLRRLWSDRLFDFDVLVAVQCSVLAARLFNSRGFADVRQMMRQEENGGR